MLTLGHSPYEGERSAAKYNETRDTPETFEGSLQLLEKYIDQEKQLEHALFALANLSDDGLGVLFQQYQIRKVFDTMEQLYDAQGGKIRMYDLILALIPEKEERQELYSAIESEADAVADRDMTKHWSASFMGGPSAAAAMHARVRYFSARDTIFGTVFQNKSTEDFLEFARAGGIEDFARILILTPDLRWNVIQALEVSHGDIVEALDILGKEHDKKMQLLHRDALALQEGLKKEIQRIERESQYALDTYRTKVLEDIGKMQDLVLNNAASRDILEQAIQKMQDEAATFEEQEDERLEEKLAPLLALEQRIGSLFALY